MLRLSLCALLAGAGACGKINTLELPDAGPDDETDASVEPGEVTVQVFEHFDEANFGEPMPDLTVLFFGPDGDLVDEGTTDDDGLVSGTVPPDSTVLVLATIEGAEHVVLGVFAIQPGDEITFGSPVDDNIPSLALGSMDIESPTLDEAGGDIDYHATNGCGRTAESETGIISDLQFNDTCVDDGNDTHVLVRAYRVATGEVLNVATAQVDFAMDGLISIAEWDDPASLEIPVTDVTPELRAASFRVMPVLDDMAFGALEVSFTDVTGEFDVNLARYGDFGDRLMLVTSYVSNQATLGFQAAIYALEPDTTDLPIVVEEDLLPWVGLPVYGEADRSMSWAMTGGRMPDVQYVLLGVTPPDSKDRLTWAVAAPPGWTGITFPDLPDEYDDWEPAGGEIDAALVMEVETNEFDGYDIRRRGITPFLDTIEEGPAPAADVGSTFRYSFGGDLE